MICFRWENNKYNFTDYDEYLAYNEICAIDDILSADLVRVYCGFNWTSSNIQKSAISSVDITV